MLWLSVSGLQLLVCIVTWFRSIALSFSSAVLCYSGLWTRNLWWLYSTFASTALKILSRNSILACLIICATGFFPLQVCIFSSLRHSLPPAPTFAEEHICACGIPEVRIGASLSVRRLVLFCIQQQQPQPERDPKRRGLCLIRLSET